MRNAPDVSRSFAGPLSRDLTLELIPPGSKEVLIGWYPKTTLDFREDARSQKRTKFGGFKYVYPKAAMTEIQQFFRELVGQRLPSSKILYWT